MTLPTDTSTSAQGDQFTELTGAFSHGKDTSLVPYTQGKDARNSNEDASFVQNDADWQSGNDTRFLFYIIITIYQLKLYHLAKYACIYISNLHET